MAKYHAGRQRASLCGYVGCRTLTTTGRCPEHTRTITGGRQFRESKAFLNSAAWIRLRNRKLDDTPWCELCAKQHAQPVPATQVDHILPRHSHPSRKLDYDNLQSLCATCHGIKTARGE